MASLINCVCAQPLGAEICSAQTGIAELYFTPYKNITTIVFEPSVDNCCLEAEIASFGLDAPGPAGLLQPINFVKQDDDSGALLTTDDTSDGGNKVRNYSFLFQSNSKNPTEECILDSMVGQEVAFLIKQKDGHWKFINWSGGLRVTGVSSNSNQGYIVVTLSGRANDRALYVSYTDLEAWADIALVPVSVDPINGLINA